jgi:membrane associated rhomboid family serine protease
VSERARRFLDVVDSLCAEGVGGKLIALGSGGAFVAMADGTAAAIISSTRGPIEELDAHLRALVEGNRGVSLKLVVVGGGPEYRELLERVKPKLMMGRTVQVFALGDDRQPWAGSGARLDSPTGRVLAECGARDEPREVDVEALRATIEAPKPEAIAAYHEQRGFAAKLEQTRPHATMAIVTGYALAFALEQMWGGGDLHPTLVRMGGVTPAALHGEPWRLLSAAWLHLGWMHLLVNGYVMYVLGGFVERLLGWRRMVIVYVACALGGGLASAALSQAPLSVGASGAIWGLLGTVVALAFRPAGVIPPSLVPAIRRTALINAGMNLAVSFLPQVDIMAHLGGGLVGLALGLLGLSTRGLSAEHPEPDDRRLQPWVIVAIAVHVAALVTAIAMGRPWALFRLDDLRTHALGGASITAPAELGEPESLPTETGARWAIGSITEQAIAIEMAVEPIDGTPLTQAELAAELAASLEEPVVYPEWLTPVGSRRVLEGLDHPTSETRFTVAGGGLRLVVWTQLRPSATVHFEGISWEQHPEVEPALRAAFESIELAP